MPKKKKVKVCIHAKYNYHNYHSFQFTTSGSKLKINNNVIESKRAKKVNTWCIHAIKREINQVVVHWHSLSSYTIKG